VELKPVLCGDCQRGKREHFNTIAVAATIKQFEKYQLDPDVDPTSLVAP